MELKIEAIDNGHLVKYVDCDNQDRCEAFKTDDEDEAENAAELARMMWHIMDIMGKLSSKYDEYSVRVNVAHGRGYVCKTKDCPICEE